MLYPLHYRATLLLSRNSVCEWIYEYRVCKLCVLQKTFEAAMLAAGCTVEAVDKVVNGELRHSMALVRYAYFSMTLKICRPDKTAEVF